MAGHAPYLLPGGQSIAQQLRVEREREQRRDAKLRAKDLQLAQLQLQRVSATSELDAAELKAIAGAGVRRRRRWFNDRVLRDMAGPLTAADMEAQFKPAPFGMTDHVSPLTQALRPEHAALWDNFRQIDPEREARVLQVRAGGGQPRPRHHRHHHRPGPGGAGDGRVWLHGIRRMGCVHAA